MMRAVAQAAFGMHGSIATWQFVQVPLSASKTMLARHNSSKAEKLVDFEKVVTDLKQVQYTYVDGPTKREMYELHKSDPNRYSLPFLATKYKMSHDRVKAILVLMKRQDAAVQRGEEIPGLQNQMDAMVAHHFQELRAAGVDPSFREVQSETSVKYRRRFFGDDEEEQELARLKRAIEKTTQAKPAQDAAGLAKKLQPDYKLEQVENRAGVAVVEKSRWKFALRDTAPGVSMPTIIRDTSGRVRAANASEEYMRSWNERLSTLDYEWETHLQEVKSGEVETFKDKNTLNEWFRQNAEKWSQIRAEDKKEFDATVKALEDQAQQVADGKKGTGKQVAAAVEQLDDLEDEAGVSEDVENPV